MTGNAAEIFWLQGIHVLPKFLVWPINNAYLDMYFFN